MLQQFFVSVTNITLKMSLKKNPVNNADKKQKNPPNCPFYCTILVSLVSRCKDAQHSVMCLSGVVQ